MSAYRHRFGTPAYALSRSHSDEQDAETLEHLIDWVRDELPFCHIRVANGEFMSIFRRDGDNAGEHDFLGATLGADLHAMLMDMARRGPDHGRFLLGGIWEDPDFTRQWLVWHDLLATLPWVPCSVWVNGVTSLRTLAWFQAAVVRQGARILVGAARLRPVADALRATLIEIPVRNCYTDLPRITTTLRSALTPGVLVLYAAGMPGKPLAWRMWTERPDTSHVDIGHFFDGAFNIRNRSWLAGQADARATCYDSVYAPRIRGEVPWG